MFVLMTGLTVPGPERCLVVLLDQNVAKSDIVSARDPSFSYLMQLRLRVYAHNKDLVTIKTQQLPVSAASER